MPTPNIYTVYIYKEEKKIQTYLYFDLKINFRPAEVFIQKRKVSKLLSSVYFGTIFKYHGITSVFKCTWKNFIGLRLYILLLFLLMIM